MRPIFLIQVAVKIIKIRGAVWAARHYL